MQKTKADVDTNVAELVHLDVIDIAPDGAYTFNESFRAACIAAYDGGKATLDDVFQRMILARAIERGFAGVANVDDLALTALEIAVADAERRAEEAWES
jgi:hypothetical protein